MQPSSESFAMREAIISNLSNPRQLEELYHENKRIFKQEFNIVYPDIRESEAARIWNERLNYEDQEITWGNKSELIFILTACFIAGLIAKIPDIFSIDPEYFYMRNIGFVIFPLLTAWFGWREKVPAKKIVIACTVFVGSVTYINLLPNYQSDTLILACIHLPLLLWATLGFAFVGSETNNLQRRLDFLRYNGDLLVMTAVIFIAGGLLTSVTFGLFRLIDLDIEEVFAKYILIWGIPSAPIIGTWLVQTNPQLVNRVSPVIAKLFTPLVLVTLSIYLIAVIITGKNPYNDREFLLIFNVLLIGVMAIIFFSIAETQNHRESKFSSWLLFALSMVTIVVNGIALSAIVYRIFQGGITPNRLAVLGGNVLMLSNLLIISYRLYRSIKNTNETEKVETSIAAFLPVYCVWAMVVTFLFPVIFSFQ